MYSWKSNVESLQYKTLGETIKHHRTNEDNILILPERDHANCEEAKTGS